MDGNLSFCIHFSDQACGFCLFFLILPCYHWLDNESRLPEPLTPQSSAWIWGGWGVGLASPSLTRKYPFISCMKPVGCLPTMLITGWRCKVLTQMGSAPPTEAFLHVSCLRDFKILNHNVQINSSTSRTAPLLECPLLVCYPFWFFFFTLFSSLIENMTSCSQDLMDGARELRKSLTLRESQPVKQSIHTALCVCEQRRSNYPFY